LSSSQIIVDLIEEGCKYVQLAPDKADPIMIMLRTQWATNDRFPQFISNLMRLRNIANSCRSPKLRKTLMRFVYTYLYAMASQSSVHGRLIKVLHSKKEEISLLQKDQKSSGLRERLFENRAEKMAREEEAYESNYNP
jgi:hypothetical protein